MNAEEYFHKKEWVKGKERGNHSIFKFAEAYSKHQNKQLSEENEKKERIAYLKGITTHTIWADYVPNGNELCDKYQEELEKLIKETGKPSDELIIT